MRKTPTYLHKIRSATQPAHQALEQLTESERLLTDTPDKSLYTRLLLTHFQYHIELGRLVQHARLEILDWPSCSRIAALRADLRQLQISPQSSAHTISYRSAAYVMGLCYVSEGSCLGNQMMHNKMKESQVFLSWQADRFFMSCREGFAQRWKSFLQLMEPYGEQHYAELEAGCLAGFELFKKLWLESTAIKTC